MNVKKPGLIVQRMAVERRCRDTIGAQSLHHCFHFLPEEREVARNSGAAISCGLEVDRRSRSQRGWRFHAVFCDLLRARYVDVEHTATDLAIVANDLFHLLFVKPEVFWFFGCRTAGRRRLRQGNRRINRMGHLRGIAMSSHVDV